MIIRALYFTIQSLLGFLKSNEYEFHVISNYLPVNGTAIDIGSNIGRYTLAFSKRVGSDGLVLSIDPSSSMLWIQAMILLANKCLNVKIFNCGVSKQNALGFLELNSGKPKSAIFTTYTRSKCNTNIKSGDKSLIVTLDMIAQNLDRVDLIKIDAEGEEINILKGGQKVLNHFKPFVIIEALQYIELINFLDKNYDYQIVSKKTHSRNIVLKIN